MNVEVAQAAIRAGYSEKTAGQAAFNLFKKVEIQNAISVSFSQTAGGVFSEWHDWHDRRFNRSCHVCALKNGSFQPNLEGGTTGTTGTTEKR
ncbi:terminase small subunit [Acetobacter persici]|uniref:terminase small subunit n=1 Tax=Acetobacter persici TaxID=1076596 RepID=UPI001BA971BD|nr:terminase small subunit [Acetobacter persici]